METKFDFYKVDLDNSQMSSSSENLSKQEFNQLFNHPSFDGKTIVLNIKSSLPKKGLLLLVSGDIEQAPPINGKPAELLSFRQIIGLPMVFGEDHSSNGEIQTSANKSNQPERDEDYDNSNDKITEPQIRYLFRLLAEQKDLKGKKAEDYLKKAFAVSEINDIRKKNASELINQFVNGGGSDD